MLNQTNPLKNKIFYASIESAVFSNLWLQKLQDLPTSIQNYCLKFQQPSDQKKRVLAYTLLRYLLSEIQIDANEMNFFVHNDFKKPALKKYPEVFFNLSYSGEYAVVALSNYEIGIDIEKINTDINLSHYQNTFPPEIWKNILAAKSPINTFYQFWTQLEATIKAHGSGFYSDTNKIHFQENRLHLNSQPFYIYPLDIHKNYVAHLASPQPIEFTSSAFLIS